MGDLYYLGLSSNGNSILEIEDTLLELYCEFPYHSETDSNLKHPKVKHGDYQFELRWY